MPEAQPMSPTQERDATPAPRFHHVAVQTNDLENSVAWYEDFLGCQPSWSLTDFSELTRDRLAGIRRLTEVAVGDVRLHVYEREGRRAAPPGESVTQFQHFCLSVESPDALERLRTRWIELYQSGRYTFDFDEQPSEIVVDADGVHSFYTLDVNGLEFEFTYEPGSAS